VELILSDVFLVNPDIIIVHSNVVYFHSGVVRLEFSSGSRITWLANFVIFSTVFRWIISTLKYDMDKFFRLLTYLFLLLPAQGLQQVRGWYLKPGGTRFESWSSISAQIILSRVLVTIDGVRIGNWIYRSQVITTTEYNTLADSHTTNHSTLNLFSVLSLVFTVTVTTTHVEYSTHTLSLLGTV
jgi:hypothetical protein